MKRFLTFTILFLLTIAFMSQSCSRTDEKKAPPTGNKTVSVTFTSPTESVYRPHSVVASFDRAIVPITTIGRLKEKGPLNISPKTPGSFHWLGTQTVSFVPDKPFPFATAYAVKIDPDLTDIQGDGLTEPVSWAFETARPTLISSTPEDGAIHAELDQKLLLYFNQPIDPGTVAKHMTMTMKDNEGDVQLVQASARRPSKEEWKDETRELDRTVIITPEKQLNESSTIKMALDKSLTGMEGPLDAGKDQTVSFMTFDPLEIAHIDCKNECNPRQSIFIEFNNPVIPKEAAKHIKLTPEVELRNSSEWESNVLYLYGSFEPATKYTMTFDANLTDIFGNKLGTVDPVPYSTGNLKSEFWLPGGFGVIESDGPKEIATAVTNVKQLNIRYKTLTKDEVIPLIRSGIFNNTYLKKGLNEITFTKDISLPVVADKNKEEYIPIPLKDGLGEKSTGLLLIDLASPQVGHYEKEIFIVRHHPILTQITDIGITAKFTERKALVWATSLSGGKPIEGAKVQVRTIGNKMIWEGTTGPTGIVMATLIPDGEEVPSERAEYFIFVEKEADTAFSASNWSQGFEPWDFGFWQDFVAGSLRPYLFTERGIYKPGETIHFKALIRKMTDGGITLSDDIKGTISAEDNRGREFFSKEITFTEWGSTSADIPIPASTATGYGNIQLKVTNLKGENEQQFSTGVQIAVYRPAEFKLDITPEKKDLFPTEAIKTKLKADYLFGEPMKDADYDWSIFRRRTDFWLSDFPAYTFGLAYFDTDSDTSEYGMMEVKGTQKGKLDTNGATEITVPIKRGSVTRTTDYIIESTVTDINKEMISSRAVVTVHPGHFYVGLKPASFIAEAEAPFKTDVIAVNIKGKKIKGKTIVGKLFKREWEAVKKKSVVGYTYESKPKDIEVASCFVTSADEAAPCNMTAPSSGLHYIKASSKDKSGNIVETATWLYVTGAGEAAWKPSSTDRMEMVADKKEYKPGEIAKILLKSPFESAEALITYERGGIIHQETKVLTGYAPTIDVPIMKAFIPNIYVSVVMVKGRISEKSEDGNSDSGKPRVKVGYIELPVIAASKKLDVAVTLDKEKASPGDEVKVSVDVKDAAGKGTASEVAIMAVDTGQLILTGYKTPNPYSTFYAKLGLGVDTTDSRIHLIGRRSYGEKGESDGGGGGADGLRSKFLPVAYWNPNVVTKTDGTATITFKLPDNLTTFKVMAVAGTVDQFGSGDAEVISSLPFMLKGRLPYFSAVGDTFRAGVVVHNYTEKSLSGTLITTAKGIEVKSNDTQPFNVPARSKQEILFEYQGNKPGPAKLTFSAETPEGSDGLELPFQVKIMQPKEVFATYGETLEKATEMLEPITDVFSNFGGLDTSVSSTALTGLTDATLYLIDYPYECLEQKISKAIGKMIYREIAGIFNTDKEKIAKYKSEIENLLFDLYTYQKWSGGFSFWTDLPAFPYLSIYATHFMTLAIENGYDVDEAVYTKAKKYIREILPWKHSAEGYSEEYLNSLKAYVLYVLALAAEPEIQYHETLYEARKTLSIASRAQLMIAIALNGGTKDQIKDFTQFINNHLAITAAEAHIEINKGQGEWQLQSSKYTDAYILLAMMATSSDYPLLPKMARYLLNNSKKGYWDSTHTTAAVLNALFKYIKVNEKEVPDFTATVMLGKNQLLSHDFKGRTSEKAEKNLPITDLMNLTGPTELVFNKLGDGRLYYRTRLTYASTITPLPPLEEGFTIFKKLAHYDKSKNGEPFRRGDIVRVQLDFVLPASRNYIVINDGLPAGLEAINFSLKTAKQHLKVDDAKGIRIDHIEIYGNKVLVFSDYLPAGSYQFEYLASASTKGTFTIPPAQIEEMYHPETFGRTMTSTIEIE